MLKSEGLGPSFTLFVCLRNGSFAPSEERVAKLSDLLSKTQGKTVILGLNAREISLLRKQGLSFSGEADLENEPFMSDVNSKAIQMAASWYAEPALKPFLEQEGLNSGELIQHGMTYFLVGILKDIAFISGLCSHENLKQIFFCDLNEISLMPSNTQTRVLLERWWQAIPPVKPHLKVNSSPLRRLLPILWRIVSACVELSWPQSRRTILISGDLKHMLPVIEELGKDKKNCFIYLRDEYGIRQLPLFLKKRISFYSFPNIQKNGEDNQWQFFSKAVHDSDCFTFRGISFWCFHSESFKKKFFVLFDGFAPMVRSLKNLLWEKQVKGILADEDVCTFNKTLILMANRKNVPSLVIQHGAPFWIVPIALAPVSCSKIAAWGEYSRELLAEWGVPPEKIKITGVPRYDAFLKKKRNPKSIRKKVCKDLALATGKKIFVLATDPFHEADRADFVGNYLTQEEIRKLIFTVIEAVKAFPNAELVIKLHPRDRYEDFTNAWIQEAGASDVKVVRTYSTPDLVQACDVLLTICSTVAIEAILCDKPVITVNLRGGRDLQPHAEKGVAVGAKDARTLKEAIKRILSEPAAAAELKKNRGKVIPEYVFSTDGKSSARAAQVLSNLMAGHFQRNPSQSMKAFS